MVCVEVTGKVQNPSCFLQVAEKAAWIEQRNRHRVAEMIGLLKRLRQELNEVMLDEDEEE